MMPKNGLKLGFWKRWESGRLNCLLVIFMPHVAPHITTPHSLRYWFPFELPSIQLFILASKLCLAFLLCAYRLLVTIPSSFWMSQPSPLYSTHVILPVFCCYFVPLGDNHLSQKSLWPTCYWDVALCYLYWPLLSTAGHLPGPRVFLQDSTPKGSQALMCCLLHLWNWKSQAWTSPAGKKCLLNNVIMWPNSKVLGKQGWWEALIWHAWDQKSGTKYSPVQGFLYCLLSIGVKFSHNKRPQIKIVDIQLFNMRVFGAF